MSSRGGYLLLHGEKSSAEYSLSGLLTLPPESWATSSSSEISGGSTELRATEALTQMSPFHVSGSQVFPTSALTLVHKTCFDCEHLISVEFSNLNDHILILLLSCDCSRTAGDKGFLANSQAFQSPLCKASVQLSTNQLTPL